LREASEASSRKAQDSLERAKILEDQAKARAEAKAKEDSLAKAKEDARLVAESET